MVDRIVPATTDDDRADGAAIIGLVDQGLVVAEPFGSGSSRTPSRAAAGLGAAGAHLPTT